MGYKILFVIHKMDYGGAEKVMAFLANRLSRAGYEVSLLPYENPVLMQQILPEVKQIDFHEPLPPVFALRRISQIFQVRKVFCRTKPDLIISFLTYPNITSILALMTMGRRIPIIISERGDPSVLQSWFTRLRDFIYNFADGYVFQTEGAKRHFNKRIQAKSVLIPNPVISDDIPSQWTGERENRIVSVGRFELIQKRQDLLIKAFSRIADQYPSMKLVLYGDGGDKAKIEGLIKECSLEDRVVLPGISMNVSEDIKKAKLFVLSSDYEGMPNALIEAMCVGLPSIATDCSPGGAAELIRNMENGILVEAGSVDELANAMDYLLCHPDEAERMGQNALKIKQDLDPEMIVSQWEEYIDRRISAKRSNR